MNSPTAPRVVETHISRVILLGDRAYKTKKPVHLPFVDYSTVERRRRFCAKELAIGSRLSPGLYLGLLEIPGPAGAGSEPAVVMRRFREDALLSLLAERRLLTTSMADALATEVARVHEAAPRLPPARALEQVVRQRLSYKHDFLEMRELADTDALRLALARLEAATDDRYAALSDLFTRRAGEGYVRELHGDLHLGNIVWLGGRPQLFDPIEFNDDFRNIDTAADLGFLLMDLTARGCEDLAERVLARYALLTADSTLFTAVGYHMVQRALVRAKVAMLSRDAKGTARYLELAARLAAQDASMDLGVGQLAHPAAGALGKRLPVDLDVGLGKRVDRPGGGLR